jgi:hypothetical protein
VFIPKKKSPDTTKLSDFRLLTLAIATGKWFMALLADRVETWLDSAPEHPWGEWQKAASGFDGCAEHAAMLRMLRDDAVSQGSSLYCVFLDIREAFPSVPHDALFAALEGLGMNQTVLGVFRSAYRDNTVRYRDHLNQVESALVERGVRQGCPASGVVFNTIFGTMLRALERAGHPSPNLGGVVVPYLAYRDDLALLSTTALSMERKLQVVGMVAEAVGLQFNQAKCAVLIDGPQEQPHSFQLMGAPLPVMEDREVYKYLGLPVIKGSGRDGQDVRRRSVLQRLDVYGEECEALLRQLHPAQALEAIRTFAFPRLPFHLRAAQLAMKDAAAVDLRVRQAVRARMRLSHDSCLGFMYGDYRVGALGLPSVEEEVAIQALAQVAKLLQSRDIRVRRASAVNLQECVQRAYSGRVVTSMEVAGWLNGDGPTLDGGGGVWRQARAACQCAALRSLKPRFVANGHAVESLRLSWNDSDECGVKAAAVIRGLHSACRRAAVAVWKQSEQGRFAEEFGDTPEGARELSATALMPEAAWIFSARARCNGLPVRTRAKRADVAEQTCRRCGSQPEWLTHVLGCCPVNLPLIKARHDAILRAVTEEFRKVKLAHLVDKPVASCVNSGLRWLRPDLQLRSPSGDELLVDVKSPVEVAGGLDRVAAANAAHYCELGQKVSQVVGRPCRVLTLVVGALGSWWRGNWTTLRSCGLGRAASRRLARRCSRIAPMASHRLWLAHTGGDVRQSAALQ